jgi:hypothetical protein
MNSEKDRLLNDLLKDGEAARREATLLAGGQRMRHRRWKHAAARTLIVILVITVPMIALYRRAAPPPRRFSAAPALRPPVRYLTDEQLLSLFTNTPVGLAKIGNRTVLIFPHPGDKERFVGKF